MYSFNKLKGVMPRVVTSLPHTDVVSLGLRAAHRHKSRICESL